MIFCFQSLHYIVVLLSKNKIKKKQPEFIILKNNKKNYKNSYSCFQIYWIFKILTTNHVYNLRVSFEIKKLKISIKFDELRLFIFFQQDLLLTGISFVLLAWDVVEKKNSNFIF